MLRAMIRKELWELFPLLLIGLALNFWAVLGGIGVPLGLTTRNNPEIPFVGNDGVPYLIITFSSLTAVLIGFWQTVREDLSGTFLFLLHRPVSRDWLIKTKLVVGIATCLLTAFVPMLTYALWAATPGTHASPFFWSMTMWSFFGILAVPLVYAGAFLSGLRPGLWWGSRLLPLFGSLLALFCLGASIENDRLSFLMFIPVVMAVLYICVRHVASSRDYA